VSTERWLVRQKQSSSGSGGIGDDGWAVVVVVIVAVIEVEKQWFRASHFSHSVCLGSYT